MEMTFPRGTVSLTLLFVVICTVDAMNYLAFPRMGRSADRVEVNKRDGMPWNMIFPRKRGGLPNNFILPRKRDPLGKMGYLAFPRMGRSQAKAGTENQASDCCGVGLKSEFTVSDNGKEELHTICTASVPVCCEGLKELADEKPNGVVYSMCLPDVSTYSNAYSKLRRIFTK